MEYKKKGTNGRGIPPAPKCESAIHTVPPEEDRMANFNRSDQF